MAVLLYAISAGQLSDVQHQHLNGLQLFSCACPPLRGIVRTCNRQTSLSRDALLEYSDCMEALREVIDIIPMRYGTFFDDMEALCKALQVNLQRNIAHLEVIQGCVEMGVRVLLHADEAVTGQSLTGLEYLRLKQRQNRAYRDCADEIARLVEGSYVGKKERIDPERSLLSMYFLVKKPNVPLFKQKIHAFQRQKLLLSGPWAAYNFVND